MQSRIFQGVVFRHASQNGRPVNPAAAADLPAKWKCRPWAAYAPAARSWKSSENYRRFEREHLILESNRAVVLLYEEQVRKVIERVLDG